MGRHTDRWHAVNVPLTSETAQLLAVLVVDMVSRQGASPSTIGTTAGWIGRAETGCGPLLAADKTTLARWLRTLAPTSRSAAHRALRSFYSCAVDADAFAVSPLGPRGGVRQVTRYARGRLSQTEAEVIETYIGKLAGRGRSPGYCASVRSQLRSLTFTEGLPLLDLSARHVEAWIHRSGSASARCQRWTAARGFYTWAATEGLALQIVHPGSRPTRTDRGR